MALGGHGGGRPLLFHGAVGLFVGDAKDWVLVLVNSHFLTSIHQLNNLKQHKCVTCQFCGQTPHTGLCQLNQRVSGVALLFEGSR